MSYLYDEMKNKITPCFEGLESDVIQGMQKLSLQFEGAAPNLTEHIKSLEKFFLEHAEKFANSTKEFIFNEIKNKNISKPSLEELEATIEKILNPKLENFKIMLSKEASTFLENKEVIARLVEEFELNLEELFYDLFANYSVELEDL